MPEICWPTTPNETPHPPKNHAVTLSRIKATDPRRVSKSEGREPENGGEQKVSARPNLQANGHQKGQVQPPEIPSPETLSGAAYPSEKSLEGRPPTPEIYWPTTPKD